MAKDGSTAPIEFNVSGTNPAQLFRSVSNRFNKVAAKEGSSPGPEIVAQEVRSSL